MANAVYIHGTAADEQDRLARLGDLTDEPFVRFVEFGSSDSILDVGSGLGNVARKLAQLAPAGEVWGVEKSGEQLSKVARDLPNLHFQQADAQALPFEEGRFDVVYCRYLLEHVGDPVQVLREMHRVLKPGGKAFVQENNILVNMFDPECPHFDRVWRQFVRLQAILGGDALVGRKLFRLFQEAGFHQIRLSIQPEVHWYGMPTFGPWVQNLIDNIRPAEPLLVQHQLADAKDVRGAIEELQRLMENELASAIFYWNRAVGQF